MGEPGPGVHVVHERIDGTQAHGVIQVLERNLRFTAAVFHKARAVPSLSEIWIESESTINESGGPINVADDTKARDSSTGKRDGVILSELDCALCQLGAFGGLLLAIDHPAIHYALRIAQRRHAVGGSKIWIDLRRPEEQMQRIVVA